MFLVANGFAGTGRITLPNSPLCAVSASVPNVVPSSTASGARYSHNSAKELSVLVAACSFSTSAWAGEGADSV